MRASEPSHRTRTPATRWKGDYPGQAGKRASASLFTSVSRVGKVGPGAASIPPPAQGPDMPSPDPPGRLPALAPYLEKLRDFPPGQILLGIVGVHGCAARASGHGRGGSWAAATWAGAGGVRAEHACSPRSHAQTLPRSALLAQASAPLLRSPGPVVSTLPPPPPRCWSPRRSCGLGAAASRAPRQRGRQRRAEGAEEGGQRGGRQAAVRSPLPLSAPRSAPPGAGSAAAASHAARAGTGCGGGDGRARGARSHTRPSHTTAGARR